MKIGVLGGGQLARMLAQAGQPLGLTFSFLSPDPQACAAPFGDHLCAGFDDEAALMRLAQWADVVTYEFENVPVQSVEFLERHVTVHPSSAALAVARDRMVEKRRFRALDIPTAEFLEVNSLDDLHAAVDAIGLPAVLKTRTHGYNGKGQGVLRTREDVASTWAALGGVPCIVEALVPFERELSLIAARSTRGAKVFYPLSENYHRDGILRLSLSRMEDEVQRQAEVLIGRLLDDLDYVGILTLELFQCGDTLLANEIAPRVHNSGHWTIEGARTSQFENHLRAILGYPLGEPAITLPSAMVNIVGMWPPGLAEAVPACGTLHAYGKAERPGRKIGHLTLLCATGEESQYRGHLADCLTLTGEAALATRVRT
ncbi:MAG: 5-(carboxyamino)imidazole ribonucleotide synthase [Acidobacteria bacterium]|nr:5-(carboxyamino)imidazole ribonucleotide synthase [Acidobacteriota bacterium]